MNAQDVAVLGLSGRFPGADSIEAFWDLLLSGRNPVGPVDPARWNSGFYWHPRAGLPGRTYTINAGMLRDPFGFDPTFFGMSPREAAVVDPQHKLLLMLAWEALEDAGVRADRIAGTEVGVYIATSMSEFQVMSAVDPGVGDSHSMTGHANSIAANRLSFTYDLRGPSFTVDTACSSALYALHLACEDIRKGRIETAIVGAANLLLTPLGFVGFSKAGMLSPTGLCQAFDSRADGYVRAEAAGVMVIRSARAAIAAGDRIRALLLGTGTNTDGRKSTLTLPSAEGQRGLLDHVYGRAGLNPDALAFVEAHGTGTPVGDPIEAYALGTGLGQRRVRPLPVGAVKSNVGHAEAAAGFVGLTKTILAIENRFLPGNLHFETPNPNIDFAGLNLEIAGTGRKLAGDRLIAGVNSFGFGGANAHVIVAEPPALAPALTAPPPERMALVLTAETAAALRQRAADVATVLATTSDEAAPLVVASAAHTTSRLSEGLVVIGAGRAGLLERLQEVAEKGAGAALATGSRLDRPRTAFVFAGNGAQWAGMGTWGLLDNEVAGPVIAEIDARFRKLAGWSIITEIGREAGSSRLNETQIAQPTLFAIQAGLVAALRASGIEAHGTAGHSVGEIAAAYAAGALDLETALTVLYHRSRLQEPYRGRGRMAAAAVGVADLPPMPPGVGVAAENAPGSVTLVGDETALAAYVAQLVAARKPAKMLSIPYPFHSALMDGLAPEIGVALAEARGRDGERAFYSSVYGEKLAGSRLDADYWWRNIRQPVRWRSAIDAALKDGCNLFIEVSAQPTLIQYVGETARAAGARVRLVSTMRREQDDENRLTAVAAEVHLANGGGSLDRWLPAARGHVPLPRYPWEIAHHAEAPSEEATDLRSLESRGIFMRISRVGNLWEAAVDLEKYPALADHAYGSTALLPASFMIDTARAFMPTGEGPVRIEDFRIAAPLVVGRDPLMLVRAALDPDTRVLTVTSKPRLTDAPWQTIFTARYVSEPAPAPVAAPPVVVGRTIDADEHLRRCTAAGFVYGPAFRPVAHVTIGDEALTARLSADDGLPAWLRNTILMDGALQALLSFAHEVAPGLSFFPVAVRRIRGRFPESGHVTATATLTGNGGEFIAADITYVDAAGHPALVLEGCVFRARPQRARDGVAVFEECLRPAGRRLPPQYPAAFDLSVVDRLAAAVPDEVQDAEWSGLMRLVRLGFVRDAMAALVPDGDVDEAVASGAILASMAHRASEWIDELRAGGLLTDAGYADTSVLPSGAELWRTLVSERPDLAIDLLPLGRAGRGLPELLRHGTPAPMALGSLRLGDGAQRAARRLAAVFRALAAEWPADLAMTVGMIGEWEAGLVEAALAGIDRIQVELVGGNTAPPPGSCDVILATVPADVRDVVALRPGGALLLVMQEAEPLHFGPPATVIPPAEWHGIAETATALEETISLWLKPGVAEKPAVDAPQGRLTVSVVGELTRGCTVSSFSAFACTVRRDTHVCFVADTIAPSAAALAPVLVELRDQFAAHAGELVFVTVGAHAPVLNVAARTAIGFLRVLATEHADRDVRLIDLPRLDNAALQALAVEIGGESIEPAPEVVLRDDGRFAPQVLARAEVAAGTQRLVPTVPGSLESLAWVPAPTPVPGTGEVSLRILATGLNFRDLMLAQGLLPSESLGLGVAGSTIGIEAAGVIEEIGPGVEGLAVGDYVVAYGSGLAATHAVVRADLTLRLPEQIRPPAAATLATAFITALHCLEDRANLANGERVLIHAATGGLGIAALQVASRRGAALVATAGSDEKRDFLGLLGIEDVHASRHIGFADAVRARHGERPIDVVLNSLTGELTRQSMALLRPFGRFVEVGKRDVLSDVKLSSLALKDNIALHVVDADQLPSLRPDMTHGLLARIAAGLQDGTLRPLPHVTVPATETISAFRSLQAAQHIGKIVLTPPTARPAAAVRPLPDYGRVLVTGGLGGLGLDTVAVLAEAGLHDLVLWSRSGAAAEPAVLEALRAKGVQVALAAVDVADEAAVAAALVELRAQGRPLVGIVHAAGVYDDAPAAELDAARIATVLRAKLDGACHLDRLTREDPLAFFLAFSSVTVALGNPGQSSYVAANAALEALMDCRRAEGRPGMAIAWGPARTGRLARDSRLIEALERRLGREVPTAAALLAALPALLQRTPDANAIVVDWEPGAFRGGLPPLGAARFAAFPMLMRGSAGSQALIEELAALPEDERVDKVSSLLTGHVARILRLPAERIELDVRLADIGFDSLMAVELGVALEEAFGRSMRVATGADLTLRDLAVQIARSLAGTEDHLQVLINRHEVGVSATE